MVLPERVGEGRAELVARNKNDFLHCQDFHGEELSSQNSCRNANFTPQEEILYAVMQADLRLNEPKDFRLLNKDLISF